MTILLFIPPKNKLINSVKYLVYHNRSIKISFLLIHFALFLSIVSFTQRSVLTYNVVQNNDVIGWLKLDKRDSANSSFIKFSSEIKKRVVFLFTIIEKQEAFFQNGIMTYSYVYRKINDNIKVNKFTTYVSGHYLVKKDKSSTPLMLNNIAYNQLSLYFYEPATIQQVYSDNYEQYLKIEKSGNQYYTLKLPGGNKNTYYYSNGVCTKVKVEQSLFTVEFILVK